MSIHLPFRRPAFPFAGPAWLVLLGIAGSSFVAGCQPSAPNPAPPDAATSSAATMPPELADGVLTAIVFPVLDEPFVAPNLDAGVLPLAGGVEHFRGVDIDLVAGFAAQLGAEVVFQRLEEPGFGALLPALVSGTGDMVASALTITEERDRLVDFSRPYFTVSTVIVARTEAAIRSLDQLEGRRGIGVKGSRPLTVLRERGIQAEIAEADFQTGAYAEVMDGNVDFAVMESASAGAAVAARPGLEIAIQLPDRESYGFAVREGSGLKALLDGYLDDIEASGELSQITSRHLGSASADPS